ncbi:MAG: hypothetical protein AAGA62_10015, partial [Bacteroidota bacterium]
EELLARLTGVGFQLSPDDRLRSYRLLESFSTDDWSTPGGLRKFGMMLGPVLCRNGAEQETFKRVYAGYLEEITEIKEVIPPPPPPRQKHWYDRLLEEDRVMQLLGLLLMGMLGIFIYGRFFSPDPEPVALQIEAPGKVREGEHHLFRNRSIVPGHDSTTLSWEWELENVESDEEILRDTSKWSLPITVGQVDGSNVFRRATLTVTLPKTKEQHTIEHFFRVGCDDPPPVVAINAKVPQQAQNFSQTFYAELEGDSSDFQQEAFIFSWRLDSLLVPNDGREFTPANLELGQQYLVNLNVARAGAEDYCYTNLTHNYLHGEEEVVLPYYPYEPVSYERISGYRTWWVILLLLGWFFFLVGAWRMWRNQIEALESAARRRREAENKPVVPAAPDAPPYGIPWVSQEALLPLEPSHLKLARGMRHRAGEGGRKHLDAKKTLRATIKAGGYPSPAFTLRRRAGEYVMLIDEVDAQSHQGRLFKRLAAELNRRDVYAEVFYYQKQLNRVWNAQTPHGLPLDEVARQFGGQRLLILGDAHELLDKRAEGRPELAPKVLSWLAAFPERLLLTPVPPIAWGYQEKALYRHFPIFPADTLGITNAAIYLQTYG